MIGLKIGLVVAALSGGAFFVYDYIATKQDNAVLDATLTSVTTSYGNFATQVGEEIYGYTEAVRILGNRDIEARKERDEQYSSIENRDLEKMARRKPNALARILTARTARLLKSLADTDRSSRSAEDAAASTPGPAQPEAD